MPSIEFDRRISIDPTKINEELETIEQLRGEDSSRLTRRTNSAETERGRLAKDKIKATMPVIDEFKTIYVYNKKRRSSHDSKKSEKPDSKWNARFKQQKRNSVPKFKF